MHQSLFLLLKEQSHHPRETGDLIHHCLKSRFSKYFKGEWTIIVETKNQPGISPGVLREAVVWGEIISYSSHKKEREICESELEQKIKTLKATFTASQVEHLERTSRKLKLELNEWFYNKKTVRQRTQKLATNPGLANQLKLRRRRQLFWAI